MAGGDSLVAHPRGCRPRSGRCRRKPGRRGRQCIACDPPIALRVPGAAVGPGRRPPARHTGAVATRPLPGSIPDEPGSYQFVDARRPGALRRQGQVAPVPGQLVLPGPGQPGAAHGPDGGAGRPRGVDGGGHRGRGPAARAQPDPAVPAPVQRPAEGRQELPVAGPHRERRVAPAGGGPGPQAQRGAVLRPVPERRGHPGHPRPAAAVVPGADVLGRQVPQPRAAGPALPAVPHRAVLRARAWGR